MANYFTLKPNIYYALFKPFGFFVIAVLIFALTQFGLNYFQNEFISFIGMGLSSIALLIYLYKFLYIKSITYKINKEQIIYSRGLFTITTDCIELYRVKDYTVKRPFLLRIINAMNFSLFTSDKTHPVFNMVGIPKSDLYDVVRNLVENQRKVKGVREFD